MKERIEKRGEEQRRAGSVDVENRTKESGCDTEGRADRSTGQ